MALTQDAIRRLTVIATETGLTSVNQKLIANARAHDDVAASSLRSLRATEAADARVQALLRQRDRAVSAISGGIGGIASRGGAETLAMVGRIAPAVLTAYAAFKLANATVERGVELLDKYGLAGQRAMFGSGVDEGLSRLTRFQNDDASLRQIQYATELSDRLETARKTISDFSKLQFDLTDPALKLMHAWVLINEQVAKVVDTINKVSPSALGVVGNAMLGAVIPGYTAARNLLSSGQGGPEPSGADAMSLARKRLAAGMGGGFVGRFNQSVMDLQNPPKDDKPREIAQRRNEWDRALDSLSRSIALQEADAKAVGLNAGAHARLRAEAQLLEAGMRAGLNEETVRASKNFQDLTARAQGAANALADKRLRSDLGFERDQFGRTDTEQGIASRMRGAGLEVDLDSAIAKEIRFNEQLRQTRDLMSDISGGALRDIRSGLLEGAKGWEIFQRAGANALNKISDKLLDMANQQLVAAAFGGTGGGLVGGFLSSIFGGGAGAGGNYGASLAGGSGAVTNASTGLVVGGLHSGGIAGRDASFYRNIHPAYFENAPRYHSGGMAGLAPDEVPAILQRGERVIPRGQADGGGGSTVTYNDNRVYNDVTPGVMAKMEARLRQERSSVVNEVLKMMKKQRGADPNLYAPA